MRRDDNIFADAGLATIGCVIDKDDRWLHVGVSFDVSVENVVITGATIDVDVNSPTADGVVGIRIEGDIIITLVARDVQEAGVVEADWNRAVNHQAEFICTISISRMGNRTWCQQRVDVTTQNNDLILLTRIVTVVVTNHVDFLGSV